MAQRRVTAPATEPVTLADAKAYLRLEDSSPANADDAALATMISAAVEWAEGFTRRALITQTWAYTLPAFPVGAVELPLGRCLGVQSVAYVTDAGAVATLAGPSSSPAATVGFREDLNSDQGGQVMPLWGGDWPSTRDDEPSAVTITYRAGYGNAAAVPAAIRQAILYRVADLYEHRGSQDGDWTGIAKSSLAPYVLRSFDP